MFRALFVLVVGTLILSSILTPIVYSGLEWLFGPFRWPFSRVYDRVAMVAVVIMVAVLRKQFSFDGIQRYFYREHAALKARRLIGGVCLSACTVAAVVPFIVDGVDVRWADHPRQAYLLKCLRTLPAAILISVIEEGFFRAFLYKRLRRHYPLIAAGLLCSLIYASVHFISPVKTWSYDGFSVFAGFDYLWHVLLRMLSPGLLPAFFGLFLVGVVLCFVMERTNSLFLCIGLHSGWVMILKVVKFSTIVDEAKVLPGAGMRYFLVAQPIAWISILLVFVILVCAIRFYRLGATDEYPGQMMPSRSDV